MTKKKLTKRIILGIVIVLLLWLIVPNVVYVIKEKTDTAPYTVIDYSVEGPDYIIGDDNYSEDMDTVVEPFLKQYEETGYLETEENVNIFYRTYILPEAKGKVVISHGFCENSEKYAEQIYYFLKEGYSVFIVDHRGHGYSEREIDNLSKVWVGDFDDYVNDFISFMENIVKPAVGDGDMYLYAHSMGGCIGVRVMEEHPEYFKKAVLSCPMLDPRCSVIPRPLAKTLANVFCFFGKSQDYVIGHYDFDYIEDFSVAASGSESRYHYYFAKCMNDDHYQSYGATYGWLKASIKGAEAAMDKDNLSKITTPCLLFMAGNDTYVNPAGIFDFVKEVDNATLIYVPDSKHEVYTRDAETQNAYRYLINNFLED